MNITIVIDSLKDDLAGTAEIGDERVAAIARRLADSLGASLRMRLQEVLAQAALEISAKLPSGHVEVRLAGQEPELVYVEEAAEPGAAAEELSARITLRLPDSLKTTIEAAASRDGVSVNTWIVRAITRATEPRRATVATGKRLTGYAKS
jgi:predicted DNA binding CopG/RHH family protein